MESGGRHYALKWYFKPSATARQKKSLETIIAKGAPDKSFLWPMEMVTPAGYDVFGYIMALRPKNYKSIMDLMKNRAQPTFYVLCRTAYNAAKGYQKLHAMGRTIIFVTHNPDIAHYSSRNIMLRDGKIREDVQNDNILSAAEALAQLPAPQDD